MKTTIIAPGPLYTFLSYCEDSPLEKEVLDCGAGGTEPPLAMFFEHGYKTHGVDISQRELQKAWKFSKDHGMTLDITEGDMRELPFADESMSFVYSYASICHMTKSDVAVAMKEIARVLKIDGLCFVSFCAVADGRWKEREPRSPGEYPYEDDGEKGVHSVYADTEPDEYFHGFTCLSRQKRLVENYREQEAYAWAELHYFARKRRGG